MVVWVVVVVVVEETFSLSPRASSSFVRIVTGVSLVSIMLVEEIEEAPRNLLNMLPLSSGFLFA